MPRQGKKRKNVKPAKKPQEPAERTSLYLGITEILRDEIRSGIYAVGDSFPPEAEICARFDVSRFTAREAMRRLEEAGYIVRRQGSSTRVLAQHPGVRYQVRLDSAAGILQRAVGTVLVVRSTWSEATAQQCRRLDLDPDREWLAIEGVRRLGLTGPAVAVTTVCVDAALGSLLKKVDITSSEPIFTQLASTHNLHLASVDQEIHATSLSAGVARKVRAKTGEPGLVLITRFTAADVGVFEVSHTTHAGEHFRYHVKFESTSKDGSFL